MNVIQCYSPTNDSDKEDKEQFHNQLQNILEGYAEKDVTVLLIGDFYAKTGTDNTVYEEVMGTHGLGEMNDNGERFLETYAMNNQVIGASLFPHKVTWVSPDYVTENQIDHLCISKRFRRSLQDVKVWRGADVASDHHLLIAKLELQLKLKKNWIYL